MYSSLKFKKTELTKIGLFVSEKSLRIYIQKTHISESPSSFEISHKS